MVPHYFCKYCQCKTYWQSQCQNNWQRFNRFVTVLGSATLLAETVENCILTVEKCNMHFSTVFWRWCRITSGNRWKLQYRNLCILQISTVSRRWCRITSRNRWKLHITAGISYFARIYTENSRKKTKNQFWCCNLKNKSVKLNRFQLIFVVFW